MGDAGQQTLPPGLGLGDLVEREEMQPGDVGVGAGGRGDLAEQPLR